MTSPHAPSPEPAAGYSSLAAPADDDRLAPGRRVAAGRYRVVRELGHGGMAIVYEAEDARTGQRVALKVVTRRLADRSDVGARYHNEARLAAALGHHPHVVRPLAVGVLPELHDRPYLVTELVRGRSLGAVVLEAPRGLPIERACRIGRDVARALVALHARGIVHRDVKPSNVMLEDHDGRERARLLDFGCAHATGDGDVAASADLTQAHERVGSPVYMAPEQALGLRPMPSFDLYALGATLYELLTGAPPYAGSSKAEIVERKCAPHDPPLPVSRVRDDVPPRLAALVDGCLRREPGDRPASAEVVLAELEQVRRELGAVDVDASPPPARWRWFGAAALVVVGGVGTWWALSWGSGDEASTSPALGMDPDTEREATTSDAAPSGGASTEATPLATTATSATPSPDPPRGTTTSSDASSDDAPAPDDLPPKAQAPRTPRPCPDVAAQAQAASRSRQWSRVLQLTKTARCWDDPDARVWLRVEALSELGLHEECVRAGARSDDPAVKRLVKQCNKHLDQERVP
jgi:serine/threonine protein kinase